MKRIEKNIDISDLLYKSLFGKLSEDEQTKLDCWLMDEENRKFYQELKEPEALFSDIPEMANIDTARYYRKIQGKQNFRRRLRLGLSGVAAVAALFALVWMVLPLVKMPQEPMAPYFIVQQLPTDRTTLETAQGDVYLLDDSVKQLDQSELEKEKALGVKNGLAMLGGGATMKYNVLETSSRGNIQVTLSDSTRVWLNAGSRLRYPNTFTGERREVELVGEAYFEVARNEQHPFIVRTGTADIEVLGTHFNVNYDRDHTCTTTLVTGCVKVRNGKKDSVIIHPGQQVAAPAGGVMAVSTVDTRFYTAWKRDRFAFQGKALYRILEDLAEWYDFTYEFDSPGLANLHFTTIVPRYPNVTDVLSILQTTQDFTFVWVDNHHIRIKEYEQD